MFGRDRSLTSLLNDTFVRGVLFQALMAIGLLLSVNWFADNTLNNLANQGKTLGFDFLTRTAGFQISSTLGTWMLDYKVGKSTYIDVYLIGIVNTFIVAFLGILAATVIGFTVGIMRLSDNLVFRWFATFYVEIVRNVPLLLQLFFWYFAVLRALPSKRDKLELVEGVAGINITGLYLPAPIISDGFVYSLVALVAAVFFTLLVRRYALKLQAETGQTLPVFWIGLSIIIVLPVLVHYFNGGPLGWSLPEFKDTGSKLRQGYQSGAGMVLVPEMLAVWLALSLYTAAFIAEIVRAGILAVNRGQTEAAFALGVRPNVTLRLVVIPQAMRVIIPPLTSQYLNLTKNSSLAVAIAYPELVSVFAGTALNQVGKEVEMIFMMMMVYLTFSLMTAAFMNWFNSRVKLVER
ncbi:amino acid ABC transporter permease [Candidatus Ponderosibacter sp. Uisw_141_02]|uniref:amino acid ABC transporter permease n=1 Tax=Candidatus Ponderosibacter sp. Uisw_141_02 TaxID=3231000 RepID=UPI003D3F5102